MAEQAGRSCGCGRPPLSAQSFFLNERCFLPLMGKVLVTCLHLRGEEGWQRQLFAFSLGQEEFTIREATWKGSGCPQVWATMIDSCLPGQEIDWIDRRTSLVGVNPAALTQQCTKVTHLHFLLIACHFCFWRPLVGRRRMDLILPNKGFQSFPILSKSCSI